MALAILDLVALENASVRFRIDTGTNRFYRLKIGRRVRREHGIDWVDEIVSSTPVGTNHAGGGLLRSWTELDVPAARFDGGHGYVQLFTFKTPDGRSPAFSRVLKVPVEAPLAMSTAMTLTTPFLPPRIIPCRTGAELFARQASWGALLGEAVRVITPVTVRMLESSAAAHAQPFGVVRAQSYVRALEAENRFGNLTRGEFSTPFIFGYDDAVIAAVLAVLAEVGAVVGPAAAMIVPALEAAGPAALGAIQTAAPMVMQLLGPVIEVLGPAATQLLGPVMQGIGPLLEGGLGGVLQGGLGPLLEGGLGSLLEGGAGGVLEMLGPLKDVVGPVLENLGPLKDLLDGMDLSSLGGGGGLDLGSLTGGSGGGGGGAGAAPAANLPPGAGGAVPGLDLKAVTDLVTPIAAALPQLMAPVIQMLPQLMNSANQKRVQLKQASNKLVTDVLSETNRRRLLEQAIDAQRSSPGGGFDVAKLAQLLQPPAAVAPPPPSPVAPPLPAAPAVAAPPAAVPASPAPPAPSASQSVAFISATSRTLSTRAIVSFVTRERVQWNGKPTLLFSRNQPLALKVKLTVGAPAPTQPLPKAAIRIVFKNAADQSVWFEKTFRQTNLAANTPVTLAFSAEELARLPVNTEIAVLAELRWRNGQGAARTALGSTDIVLTQRYFLVGQGSGAAERELNDMTRFKPFWNKVWQSPALDTRGDAAKYLWELNVNAKYTVLLSAAHDANGLMETRLARSAPDPDSLTDTIDGRMKAGIELSVRELNKLLPLWDAAPLDADRLEALCTPAFASQSAGEFTYNLRMRGKASERGMVWVVPVFKLFDLTLSSVQQVDETGQVLTVADETVRFPLPVSARVIGLKSEQS